MIYPKPKQTTNCQLSLTATLHDSKHPRAAMTIPSFWQEGSKLESEVDEKITTIAQTFLLGQ